MNFLDITPYIKPKPVLNFNFSTILLFRCTRRKYAETFVNGEIYFNQPKNWIQYEKDGEKGRGDLLEGTFISARANDTSDFISNLKKDTNLEYFGKDEYTYFRRKGIENIYSVCFYGVKDNAFSEKSIDEKGKAHYIARVDNSYFTDFSDNITEEEYDRIENQEKPVVLFINNPHMFFKKIRDALKKIGLTDDEIIISPVQYLDKKVVSISAVPYPMELLLKDNYYSNQSEIRIIINSKNKKFLKYMKENNNTVNIGNITDITNIYDYYFKELLMERTGKNSMIFTLPKPIKTPVDEMNLKELLTILNQVSNGTLPQKIDDEEKKLIKEYIEDCIKEKYKIDVVCNKDVINIYNADENIFKFFDEMSKPIMEIKNFEKKLKDLIYNSKYEEAFNEIKNNSTNKNFLEIGEYYKGKIYEEQKEWLKAIEQYSYCIDNELKEKEALSSRANCYSRLGKYEISLQDLDLLQEKMGYNYQIYNNKGINLIRLKKYSEAIIEFDNSLRMEKNNASAYYNRSVAYFNLNEFKKAKADIKAALNLKPQNEFYLNEYNRCYKNL